MVNVADLRISARLVAGALVLAGFACAAGDAAAAGVYKWTDEKGVVHYSDRIPADSVSKGATVLDKQGRALRKIEPVPTAEQRHASEVEAERQREQAKIDAEQARRDRALTQSFSSEAEIDVARGRAISTIEAQIKTIQTYIADMSRRKQELERRKVALGAKPVPATLDNELGSVTDELKRQTVQLAQKQESLVAVGKKYDADKKRWQEIKAEQQVAADRQRALDEQKAAARAPAVVPAPGPQPRGKSAANSGTTTTTR